ncbi:CC0125/CC1285 family lipoprotein [Trinickia sp.]|uniref:CC0125/CC1285 family lipoprotein n=1 Tax=Trinickia sp. TaxID=2571163 RepID=UPI003F7EABE1
MTMKRVVSICALAAITALAGCATPYQAVGLTGGYTGKQVDDQTYHVQFSGNGYTSKDMVHKYFMYRCAEVTQQHGYKYFMIIPAAITGSLPPEKDFVRGTGFDRNMMRKVHVTAPVIIYGGGGSVYWTNSSDIRMFNDDAVISTKIIGWEASEVIDDLGGYVHSGGQTAGTIPSAWVFEPGHPKVRAQDLLPTAPTAPQKPTSAS